MSNLNPPTRSLPGANLTDAAHLLHGVQVYNSAARAVME